jgi:hypothetical protein
MKNIINYYRAYFNNRLFVCKKTGALYISGGVLGFERSLLYIIRSFLVGFGPTLGTADKLALDPGIGYSTSMIEKYSDMDQFEYVGKL